MLNQSYLVTAIKPYVSSRHQLHIQTEDSLCLKRHLSKYMQNINFLGLTRRNTRSTTTMAKDCRRYINFNPGLNGFLIQAL